MASRWVEASQDNIFPKGARGIVTSGALNSEAVVATLAAERHLSETEDLSETGGRPSSESYPRGIALALEAARSWRSFYNRFANLFARPEMG